MIFPHTGNKNVDKPEKEKDRIRMKKNAEKATEREQIKADSRANYARGSLIGTIAGI